MNLHACRDWDLWERFVGHLVSPSEDSAPKPCMHAGLGGREVRSSLSLSWLAAGELLTVVVGVSFPGPFRLGDPANCHVPAAGPQRGVEHDGSLPLCPHHHDCSVGK